MKILLILIMIMGGFMITFYLAAMISKKHNILILFRIAMLLLITLLFIAWITSIVLGQHFILLLALAIIFIALYIFS